MSSRPCAVIGACPEDPPVVTPLPNPLPRPGAPSPPPLPPAPPPPPPPPARRSVAGIAVGSAAAAAVLVSIITLYCLVLAQRRRRANQRRGDHAAEAPTPTTGSSDNKLPPTEAPRPWKPVAVEPKSINLSPPPSSSSSMSSASLSAASRESIKSPRPQEPCESSSHMPAAAAAAGILLFRGAFQYEELAAATDGFADSNLVGRGGFGDVYAGTLDGGAAVAVKRLRAGSQQGDREFQAEVRTIGRVHHRNLVSLVGYCVATGGRRLLVYEFVPNMTLEYHLHGELQTLLDWPTRWKIAVGAAKGLAYLHEDCHPRIIHRDIKAANILLDADFNPKVSDFGLAKFIPVGDTHVSTRIVGTIGYLAPEYATSGRLTEKSDVFSFGVVLLELVTGMSATISSLAATDDTLVGWARPLLSRAIDNNIYDDLVDPLLPSFDAERMMRLVRCATAAIVRHLEGDASAEEIDACGARSVGATDSAAGGDTKVQFPPMRYHDIRMSRRQAMERMQHHR